MAQFIKFVFASCLGVFLAMIVLLFVGGAMAGGLASSMGSKEVNVKPNSVLELTFTQPVPERTNNVPMDPYSFENETVLGLHDMVKAIEKAKSDDKIKGIFIDASSAQGGFATRSVIRDALVDFKESGKFITAYSKYYNQSGYYMASVADEVYVNPAGGIDFRGFGYAIPFFKEGLDKLGVNMKFYYVGKFKSASEPFRLNKMSAENRKQIKEYLNPIYDDYINDIAASRDIAPSELKRVADDWLVRLPDDAVTYKLADKVGYRDEVITSMKERMGLEEDDKIAKVNIEDYASTVKSSIDFSVKDKVAVIYAEGGISMGEGEAGSIQDDQYTKIISKIRKDDKIKAIVLRVNSGGGSALASENMWREFTLAKKAGKPMVVSMGDVAASGGYYIACMADKIYAEPNTITGSIGIFGMIPNAQELMKEKLGISLDTVNIGRFSNSFNIFHEPTAEESAIMQQSLDAGYELFLKRVYEGRGMTREEAHEIAQGRVWTGTKAKEIGLIDELGGLDDAIAAAAELAEIESYRVSEYPKIKEPIQQLIEKYIQPKEAKAAIIKAELGALYPYYKETQEILNTKGPQARMPFVIKPN